MRVIYFLAAKGMAKKFLWKFIELGFLSNVFGGKFLIFVGSAERS
jgi:hypothetical protein